MAVSSTPPNPSNTSIDRIPVANLPTRYGIKQAALYERLKELGIKPHRSGRSSFLDAEQLRVMDALDEHLKRGEGMKVFAQEYQISLHQTSGENGQPSSLSFQQTSAGTTGEEPQGAPPKWMGSAISALRDTFPTFWAAGGFLLAPLSANQEITNTKLDILIEQGDRAEQRAAVREETELLLLRYDRLQKLIDLLESIATRQVTLSTSDVADLLGLSPATVGAKKSFERMGFRFVKAGRSGRETAWAISKVLPATGRFSLTNNADTEPEA